MPDIANQKELREFCAQTECEVWRAIQAHEDKAERHPLRTYCARYCRAYEFVRWLDFANKVVQVRKDRHH
jgi:hypothetical protein